MEYMRPWWREKKQRNVRINMEWSYEKMQNDDENFEIADSFILQRIVEDRIMLETLSSALEILTEKERNLIEQLYNHGLSERELSVKTGIPRKTIAYRKEKVLKKLKNIFEKN